MGETQERDRSQKSEKPRIDGLKTGGMDEVETIRNQGLTGRQVVSSDGRLLGMVADANADSEFIMVRSGEKIHPVPAHLVREDIKGLQLKTSFDQETFRESPSISDTEKGQASDSRLEEARQYFGNKIQGKRE